MALNGFSVTRPPGVTPWKEDEVIDSSNINWAERGREWSIEDSGEGTPAVQKRDRAGTGGDGTGGSGHSRRRTGIQVCKATVAQSRERAEHGRAIINSSRSGLGVSKGNGPEKPQGQGFVVSLSPDPILVWVRSLQFTAYFLTFYLRMPWIHMHL